MFALHKIVVHCDGFHCYCRLLFNKKKYFTIISLCTNVFILEKIVAPIFIYYVMFVVGYYIEYTVLQKQISGQLYFKDS